MEVWIMEIVKGAGRVFTQPFLYIAIIMGFILTRRRIKSERRQFGTRIYDAFSEWGGTLGTSLAAGLLISVFAVGSGLVLSLPLLLLVSGVLLVLSIPLRSNWYSAAYTLGATYLVIYFIPYFPESVRQLSWVSPLTDTPLTALPFLISAFLLVEGILMLRTSSLSTFPERVMGRRGMWIGQHRSRKLALIPFFALFPAGSIEPFAPWWPVFGIGEESFGLILVPFVTGWEWIARGQLPVKAAKIVGRRTFFLALFVLSFAAGSLFLPVLSIVAVVISLLGRTWIRLQHLSGEKRQPFFSANQDGLLILGIIPKSPAAQMGLSPGELVVRVNNRQVRTENDFYEALQENAAFNKIEVHDVQGENRYVQRPLYEGEHYELGLVFVEPPRREKSVSVY
ncbi:PDZ domain-containing protein [Halobacillus halophilus]|uniref:PDZ domain-containing protein n=1 Tax=Halobacillus halophilus TaxID=1570 RepID=UPI001CD2D1B5|nr:PDZ domain-containing protein [Halobacillus halophilus]MCA1011228.1 PDZ domain-containing protein [Halobacillus halophilus]